MKQMQVTCDGKLVQDQGNFTRIPHRRGCHGLKLQSKKSLPVVIFVVLSS